MYYIAYNNVFFLKKQRDLVLARFDEIEQNEGEILNGSDVQWTDNSSSVKIDAIHILGEVWVEI